MPKIQRSPSITRLPVSKARFEPADILYRVAFSGERIILHRHDKDIAAVISLEDLRALECALKDENSPGRVTEALFELAAIVESSNDAIIGKTLDGIITNWNPGAEKLYGYSAEEINGKPISILIPANRPDEVPQILERISRGERVNHYETVRVKKNGQYIYVSLTVSPIMDATGKIIGASTIARDITERKEAEEELRISREQLRALSARLQSLQEEERAMITHEIQSEFGQALTALKLDLAWLNKRLPVNREPLQKKIEKMNQLIDTTIQAMRKISTELRPKALDDLGLVAAIEWEVQEFQKRTAIECDLNISPDYIALDTARSITTFRILQEALTNIARHATRATINIKLKNDSSSLLLEIRDNGSLVTGREPVDATSLDLVGIRERALLLGGDLQISSIEGEGTAITVEIPMPDQMSAAIEKRPASKLRRESEKSLHKTPAEREFQWSGKKTITNILIADNYAVVREGLKQILAEIPDVVVAGEASSAQEILRKLRTSNWDVIVMDISLPDKNGLDLLKQIKVEYPKLPVLVLSAQAEEQYALRVLKAGASGYLTKESAPDQLIEAVQKVARGGQYVSSSVAEKLIFDLRTNSEKPLHKTLSDREFQVLCLIASGKKLTEIAHELHLSIKTISTYRTKLLQKMGMKNNVELVHYAIENHLAGI